MPLPVLALVGILFGAAAITSASSAIAVSIHHHKKTKKILKKKPNGTPRPPPGMTRDELTRAAQQNLGMDATNHFNFGFCGAVNSGKSTLINALRNIEDVDLVEGKPHNQFGSAPTGEWQTTKSIFSYAYPKGHAFQNVRLWDMPGCGTHEHPSATYFEDKVLYAFDVLMIVSEKELGEYEYTILEKAQKQNIPVVIVSTKIDQKIESKIDKSFNSRNPPLDEYKQIVQEVADEARQRLDACLQKKGLQGVPIFIVSAWKYRNFMKEEQALVNADHQELVFNQEAEGDELLGQQVSDQGVNTHSLIDHEAQRQFSPEEEAHIKTALVAFELHQLLYHVGNAALRRRL